MAQLTENKSLELEGVLANEQEKLNETGAVSPRKTDINDRKWELLFSKIRTTLKVTVKYLLLILMCLVLVKELLFRNPEKGENKAVDVIFTELLNLLHKGVQIGSLTEDRNEKINFTTWDTGRAISRIGQNLF